MSTTNISLPNALRNFVETRVDVRGYGTNSEFVSELIRREQARVELRTPALARFPYLVLYAAEVDAIRIRRVLHSSRDVPTAWNAP